MTREEAAKIIEKQFDESCGDYRYQNKDKLDYEDALWLAIAALRQREEFMPPCYKPDSGDKTDKCFNEHRAHWIKENDICYDPDASCFYAEYSCSYCGAWANDRSELPEYCPTCGKKMKGK